MVLSLLATLVLVPTSLAITNYANDFVDPSYVTQFKYPVSTIDAQQTIIQWANQLDKTGPWSVTNKPYTAPSGDNHDYLSWAPYFWPNCTGVGNTTVLPLDEEFQKCTYTNIDGSLNPDARSINNVGDFDDMANAVLFNALSWGITRSAAYSMRVASYIDTWFLNSETYMNPNLNYAQLHGGPDGQTGSHTGVLDLKCMVKIASGVMILREGNADGWNSTIDGRFQDWVANYTTWLTTAQMAIDEKTSANNHATFYYAQLASLYLIRNDTSSAASTAKEYFDKVFNGQVMENGDQPLEEDRTRPFHYLAYNLCAMMTVGKLGLYAGYNGFNTTSTAGGTIPKAASYLMNFNPGKEKVDEVFQPLMQVASIYGDPDGTYANYVNKASAGSFISDASFFWNQPMSEEDVGVRAKYVTFASAAGGGTATGTLSKGVQPTGGTNADSGKSSNSKGGASRLSTSWAMAGFMALSWALF